MLPAQQRRYPYLPHQIERSMKGYDLEIVGEYTVSYPRHTDKYVKKSDSCQLIELTVLFRPLCGPLRKNHQTKHS